MLDDSAHFVFVIGFNGNGVPVRFYRGAAEEPTEWTLTRHAWLVYPAIERLQSKGARSPWPSCRPGWASVER